MNISYIIYFSSRKVVKGASNTQSLNSVTSVSAIVSIFKNYFCVLRLIYNHAHVVSFGKFQINTTLILKIINSSVFED